MQAAPRPYDYDALLFVAEGDLLWAQLAAPPEDRGDIDAIRARLTQLRNKFIGKTNGDDQHVSA